MYVRCVTRRAVYVSALLSIAVPAAAEWTGKGELGLVLARGNTEQETINAKADLIWESESWKYLAGFSFIRSTSDDELTGDRFEIHGQSDYSLSQRSYLLGSLRFDEDQFSPYSYQAVASIGYGYKFYDTETTKLSTEVGVGYRRADDRLTGETESDPIFRGGLNYEHKLTSNTDIYDKLLVEAGETNTFYQNELGIKVSINDTLALSVSYQIRHNTDVNEDALPSPEKTDELMTANLVFDF